MHNQLEERVSRALASTIRIIAKIGEGGMGVVYRGRHLQLDVDVAVKVLRPELAGAEMVERFRREAQLMARFKHPNIIQVLDLPSPDQVDGLHLFVMEYVKGTSLAERLSEVRLKEKVALELGKQLLGALTEVHRRRVVHRDIKPSNLVFDTIRAAWVLTDFGIARILDTPTLSEPNEAHGTVDYMPPDKEEWRDVTVQLDLYAAAATIFEGYTGEAWNKNTSPSSAGWSRIPRRQAAALRKGIAPAKDRWRTAEEFKKAFEREQIPPIGLLAMAAVVAGILVWRLIWPCTWPWGICPAPPVEVAFAGFTTTDPSLQEKVADLNEAVRAGLNAVLDTDPSQSCDRRGGAQYCVLGDVSQVSDSLNATVTTVSSGRSDRVTLPRNPDPAVVAGPAVVAILSRTGHPGIIEECRLPASPSANQFAACEAYHQGVRAFQHDDWPEARRHFRRAIELNLALTDALWRLYTTDVWRREDPGDSIVLIIKHHRKDLPEMDGLLFDAQQTPQGTARLAMFEAVVRRYDSYAFPQLLYGSELFHRGALSGVPLDSSAAVLRRAVENDSNLTEAYDQLLWVLIRLGNRAATDSVLAKYPPAHRGALFFALSVAREVRFDPAKALQALADLGHADTAGQRILRQTFRFGPSLDIPLGEMFLGQKYAASPDAATRADGYEGLAVAELIMGMTESGLAHADSAVRGEPGVLEAAEWRVILSDLGVIRIPDPEAQRSRDALRSIARSSSGSAARAAWALATDAFVSGDVKTGATWEAVLASQTARDTVVRLSRLLTAVKAGVRGSYAEALRLSQQSLAFDEAPQVTDPFFRAVLHFERGRWGLSLGDSALARREWLWSDNADIQGWSQGPAQAAEVDWVVGSLARVLRARLEHCAGIARADTILQSADAARFPAVDSAKACHP
ncbi:MAG TPA: serine/threonine-protein kinase [Gemmatimonadales bacterium]|nr:serine/threonine-protein kinase [Gemmatimonadales bacterium]